MSAGDYPEHLNPFHEDLTKKSGLHLSHAFKGFKKTLRQSFRIKKDKRYEGDVEIRNKDPFFPRYPQNHRTSLTVSMTASDPGTSPALPRSRFRERLAMSYSPNRNPFEDELDEALPPIEPKPRARRKKRAPPPPKSSSSQNMDEETDSLFTDSRNTSKWSLVSDADTSVQSAEMSDTSGVKDFDTSEVIADELQNFNKEMKKLNDDANNNIVEDKVDGSVANSDESEHCTQQPKKLSIPDVVVSCADDSLSKSINNGDTQNGDSVQKNSGEAKIATTSECLKETEVLDSTELQNKETEKEEREMTDDENCKELRPHTNVNNVNENHANALLNGEKEGSVKSGSSSEDLHITDVTSNLRTVEEPKAILLEEAKMNEKNSSTSQLPINYNERKSIYITGSQDNLDQKDSTYTQEVNLYIVGSREELDVNDKSVNDNDSHSLNSIELKNSDTPTPKQRKNKLSKAFLLGQRD